MHPKYFDRQALTACWREGLLAQAVLGNPTGGYGRHPQLERFRSSPSPSSAVSVFLGGIADEADARGYSFNRGKILPAEGQVDLIPVTTAQLAYEWGHLRAKLERRSPAVAALWEGTELVAPHPLFTVIEGPIASWERPRG